MRSEFKRNLWGTYKFKHLAVRQWLFITIIFSWGSCSLCVYCDCNNGFYYFLCNPLSPPSIKNKNSEKTKNENQKTSSGEYTKFSHLSGRVLVDVPSLTCLFHLFTTAMFYETTRGKLLEKGKNMCSSGAKAKDSTL